MDENANLDEDRGNALGQKRLSRLPRLEPHRYQQHLGPDIDEETAAALLETLWSIMCTFVELGWGVESVQKVLPFSLTGPDMDRERVGTNGDHLNEQPGI